MSCCPEEECGDGIQLGRVMVSKQGHDVVVWWRGVCLLSDGPSSKKGLAVGLTVRNTVALSEIGF